MRMTATSVLGLAGLFAIGMLPEANAQTWSFTETKDVMTDRSSWSLVALPEAPAPPGAHFKIQCFGEDASSGDPNVNTLIEWGVPIYPLYPDGDGVHAVSVDARFGDGDPVTLGFSTSRTYTLAWQPSTGQQLLGGFGELFMAPLRGKAVNFTWTPLQLYISATTSSPLVFRASAVDGNPVTLVFREDGLLAALQQMPDACLPDGYRDALAGGGETISSRSAGAPQDGSGGSATEPRMTSTGPLDLFGRNGWTKMDDFDAAVLPTEAFAARPLSSGSHFEISYFEFMKSGTAVIRVMDPGWGPVQLFFLIDSDSNAWWLNGTAPPLYQYLSKHTPVIDTELKARQMFYFYMFFIQGEEGPFAVVESVDDYLFPSLMKTTSPDITAKIKAHLKPSKCTGGSPTWTCTSSIFYSNALFDAVVEFEAGGKPAMQSDNPVFVDLPVKIAMPIR